MLELLKQTQYESFDDLIYLKYESELRGLHKSLEKINQDTLCQIEKYKLLLEVDAEAIQSHFKQLKTNGLTTEKICQNFETALEAHYKKHPKLGLSLGT